MAEFTRQDLNGSRFEQVYLREARFDQVDLERARFRNVYLMNATIRGAVMTDLELDGDIDGLVVNGVEIAPLVEAELNRRDPERTLMRPATADGFRQAWEVIERRWAETVERARALPEEQLHERVDDEWSFIETLRHLVFATDSWVLRAYLGKPSPHWALGLPHDEMDPSLDVPWDREARPSLEEVLAVRADRMATVRQVCAELTDERLREKTTPVEGNSYPEPDSYDVRRALGAIVNEEWEHRRFAERDLSALERRGAQ